MGLNEQIRDSIREIAKSMPVYSVVCTVSDVNTTDKTCNCTPVNGDAVLMGVRLVANNDKGFMLIPTDGSIVVVSMLNNATGFVSMCSQVDEIWLNGNNYDGLVKIGDLVEKLNNLENKVNTIINTYNAHTHVASSFGSPTTTPTAPVVGTLTPTIQLDLENLTVKQGNGS